MAGRESGGDLRLLFPDQRLSPKEGLPPVKEGGAKQDRHMENTAGLSSLEGAAQEQREPRPRLSSQDLQPIVSSFSSVAFPSGGVCLLVSEEGKDHAKLQHPPPRGLWKTLGKWDLPSFLPSPPGSGTQEVDCL